MVCYNNIMCFELKIIYHVNRDLIFSYMTEKNIDIEEFCKLCNITLKEFSDLMKNDADIDTVIFCKVIYALNITIYDLLGLKKPQKK